MVLIRLRRGDEDFDKVVEVTEEEFKLLNSIAEKFGTFYDAKLTDEQEILIYEDIENRPCCIPKVAETFYMRER